MDAELKRKWIEALRSGKYEQGRYEFKNKDGRFCCLGVLCRVADEPISGWAGGNWRFVNKATGSPNTSDLLARMNDGGKTFPEIADWIEKNIPTA